MEFLAQLGQSGAGGNYGFLGNVLASGLESSISKALFGRTDRLSNRDFQHYQNLADQGNPREIARQNEFLAGVTPGQADAYNTYQDMTYAEDTQRQTDRITQMADGLGMSPWEITGSSGAAPLPAPSFGNPQNGGQGFMASLVPLKIAEMQNQTQLELGKLNAATQLETTRMNTSTSARNTDVTADMTHTVAKLNTANGQVPIKQIELIEAQKGLNFAQESKTNTETSIMYNTDRLNTIKVLGDLAARTVIDLPGYKRESNNQYAALIRLYNQLQSRQVEEKDIDNFLKTVPQNEMRAVEQDVRDLSRVVVDAAGQAGDAVGGFLGGLFKDRQPVGNRRRRIG